MRLFRAEILKLVRRRGLMAWSVLLTVGSVVVALAVLVGLHVASPETHGPAGGAENLRHLASLLSTLGAVGGILIGTTAGSQDLSAGVFRDLVVAGRSRRALFRVRAAGALAVYLPLLAIGFAIAVAGSYVFAGDLPAPTLHDIASYGLAIFALNGVTVCLGVALGSMIPARIATGVLVGWNAILAPLLVSFTTLGAARIGIDTAAAQHFAPDVGRGDTTVAMAGATAALVLALWAIVPLRVGEWWTRRIDV